MDFLTPLKIDRDGPAAPEDSADRLRQSSWRKLHGSSPQTPVGAVPITPVFEDTDEARSDRPETPAPRRDSKPKLARYTSLFTNFKETAKTPDFSEPWSEDSPPVFPPYVDPLDALQAVRLHMVNSYEPIPREHYSGLFRIFEDYRKSREQKERYSELIEVTLQNWENAEEQWEHAEDRYGAEIRRLELVIARGTGGMTGLVTFHASGYTWIYLADQSRLMQARQGSIVGRNIRHRKTISHSSLPPAYKFMSNAELDAEIKQRSQKVGAPPELNKTMTLSRRVQSELNLVSMRKGRPSITSSVTSGFSGGSGDPLPDEAGALVQADMDPSVECDALVALRELGMLVARRRGLETTSFIRGLMMLLSHAGAANVMVEQVDEKETSLLQQEHTTTRKPQGEQVMTPTRSMRKYQSQPQLSSYQTHRRQFSFEPGADQLHALTEEARISDPDTHDSDSDDEAAPLLAKAVRPALDSRSTKSNLSAEFSKPSKIPSPVQTMGRMRREGSGSSLQSVCNRPQDSRRGSHSSVLTAFRENSSGNLRPALQARNSSLQNSSVVNAPVTWQDLSSSTQLRNGAMSLAAARAGGSKSQTSSLENSPRPSMSRAGGPERPVNSK
ncbi:agc dmpk kinase [Pyrenophora seminiperda CCB06]|uniref:Agc dmpk kinase n=1 Tax=Pyrenophora seminiperda CCB06 TaxID=1302712 RepID=A0A3M7M7X6_9PLEO|nr:agc dmpk kinase [Pyrenophora seminiperda CCB06]